MSGGIFQMWVYLSTTPLLWLTVTLAAYVAADWVSARFERHPAVNPVVIAVALIIAVLSLSGTDFKTYFDGAQFVHFLLGPATVALAVPLYQHLDKVRAMLLPMAAALLAGALTAVVSAVGLAWLLGASAQTLVSIAPKSVTAPIAMGISTELGGLPTLTAVLVVLTGIIGAMTVGPLMNAMRITDWAARGFAVGIASHGIGTARAFQVNELAGTFAAIAMGLNGFLTAALVPLLAWLLE